MAMIHCPECGREVSDQAATCPGCGHPLGAVSVAPTKREQAASLRGGAIVGLVGGLSFVAVLVVLAIGTMQSTKEPTYTIVPASEGIYGILYSGAFIAIVAVTFVFLIALIAGGSLKRKAAVALSACAVVLSAVGLLGIVICFSVSLVCLGWFFLWEPILELVGSIKMLRNALRYEE